jgi:flagellar biosynthesis component FlhA
MLILRISIADHEAVAAVMAETADESVAAEELITRFSSSTIELQAPQEFLDELFRDSSVDVAQLMSDFRDAVTDQLGLTVPAIEPVPCADLHDRAFRFKVNDMAGLPWIGLPPDKCLVGAEPAALELFEIRAEPALHPAAGTAASAIAQEDRLSAEALDLWVWGPMEHVLMCLGATLRAHAGCMIHWGWVEEALDSFGHYSPALNDAVRADLPPRQLVGLLRRLVAEGLSIGNLPLVLDLRLEYEAKAGPWPVCAQSSAASLTGDVSAPDAESFVRSGMPRSTLRRWRASADTSELPAIMVDAALEALLETRAEPWLDEGDRDRLLDHLQEEVDFVPAGRGMPVLITSPGARAPLRKIVAQEFPKMGVLSRLELPPEAVLQPLGQLRLT